MEAKIRNPEAWFQCRYCLKCIQGPDSFIEHKREKHTEEFYKNREEKSRQAAEEEKKEVETEKTQGVVVAIKATGEDGELVRTNEGEKELGLTKGVDDSHSIGISIRNNENPDRGKATPPLLKLTDKEDEEEDEVVIVHDDADLTNSCPGWVNHSGFPVNASPTSAANSRLCDSKIDDSPECQQANSESQHSLRNDLYKFAEKSSKVYHGSQEMDEGVVEAYDSKGYQPNWGTPRSDRNSDYMCQDFHGSPSQNDEAKTFDTKFLAHSQCREEGASRLRHNNRSIIGKVFPMRNSFALTESSHNDEFGEYEGAMSQCSESSSVILCDDMDIIASDIEPEISDSEIYTAEDGIEPNFTNLLQLENASAYLEPSSNGRATGRIEGKSKSLNMLAIDNSKLNDTNGLCEQAVLFEKEQRIDWSMEHDNFVPYQCQLCSDSFAKECMLAAHMITHYEKRNTCDQNFKPVTEPEVNENADHSKSFEREEARETKKSKESKNSEMAQANSPTSREGQERLFIGEAKTIAKGILRGIKGRYKCPFCVRTLGNSPSLISHLRTHTGEMPLKCRYCDETFLYGQTRAKHEKCHPNHQAYSTTHECKHCPVVFRTLDECINHEMRHTNNDPYGCRSCPRFFPSLSILNHHEMTQHHRSAEVFVDSTLSKDKSSADDSYILENSTNSSTIDSTELFASKNTVEEVEANSFIQLKTGKKKYQLLCSICPSFFPTLGSLKLHEREHSAKELYKCSKCHRCYRRPFNLFKHKQVCFRTDLTKSTYKCKFCNKDFSSRKTIRYHENLHTGNTPYMCTFCPKEFSSPEKRRRHKKAMHKTGWTHNDHAKVAAEAKIDNQIRYTERENYPTKPTIDKIYECEFCVRKFATSISRQYHQNIHTGNNPFKCRVCPQAFTHPSYRTKHEKAMHNGKVNSNRQVKIASEVKMAPVVNSKQNQTLRPAPGELSNSIIPSESLHQHSGTSNLRQSEAKTCSMDARERGVQIPESCDHHSDSTDGNFRSNVRKSNRLQKCHKCTLCSKVFNQLNKNVTHASEMHSPIERNSCGKKYATRTSFLRHQKNHLTKSHNRAICKKMSATEEKLEVHSSTHLKFPCPRCKQKFALETELHVHFQKFHIQASCTYNCVSCKIKFVTSSALWEHVNRNLCLGRPHRKKSTGKKGPVQESPRLLDAQYSTAGPTFCATHKNQFICIALEEGSETILEKENEASNQERANSTVHVRAEDNNVTTMKESSYQENSALDEDSEESLSEESDSDFYFKCSICKVEFRNSRIAKLHITWHREKLRKPESK